MVKLIKVEKSKNPKFKYTAFFQLDNGKSKKTNFGATGFSDYTIHKDKDRRTRYRARHQRDLRTNDPTRAGFLSFILWSKPTLKESISFYKSLLNKYNKDGNIENFKKELLNVP
jgi:hypothetical protein